MVRVDRVQSLKPKEGQKDRRNVKNSGGEIIQSGQLVSFPLINSKHLTIQSMGHRNFSIGINMKIQKWQKQRIKGEQTADLVSIPFQ